MDKMERTILLSRLHIILRYVAWEKLQLRKLDDLRDEVDAELFKLTHEEGKR